MQLPVYCPSCAGIVNVDAIPGRTALCPTCASTLPVEAAEDAFISFSFKNIDEANKITRALMDTGIRAWLAPNRTEIGEDFLDAFSAALFGARAYVLLLSRDAVESVWVKKELLIAQQRKIPTFAIMLERVSMPQWMQAALAGCIWEEQIGTPIEQRLVSLASSIQRRIAAVAPLAAAADTGVPTPVLSGVRHDLPPYVGPQPYESHESGKFFGRDNDAANLIKRVREKRTVLVYAASGAGKTSLLKTIVREGLEQSGAEVLRSTRVGVVLPEIVTASPDRVANVFSYSAVSGFTDRVLRDLGMTLAGYLSSLPARDQTWARVVIFDQFEELFTQHQEHFEERAKFIQDVCDALDRCPNLRIIFSMRQEYLANLDEVMEHMPEKYRPDRVWLRRMDDEAALEAITRPAAPYFEFEPAVSREIVRQLNLMHVTRPDGSKVKRHGEFIELVHLQIVCRRLWSRLPEGLKLVQMQHLELAAGEGRRFDEFVENALEEFYNDVVAEVSRIVPQGVDQSRKAFPPQLIRLGCLKFVSNTGIRITLLRDKDAKRTGRLPDWIIQELEQRHLIRAELRGGEPWYELSHDLLAETVSQKRDRELSLLLAATEQLETTRKLAQSKLNGSLTGYFKPHPELLPECGPFRDQTGLFEDEASLILRASLASGEDTQAWSRRVATDFPQVHDQVIEEAIACSDPKVRANTAALLGSAAITRFNETLVDLALKDPDQRVRKAAAEAIGHADNAETYQRLVGRMNDPAQKDAALTALSQILTQRDKHRLAPGSDRWFEGLSTSDMSRVRTRSRVARLRESMVAIPFLLIPSAIFSATAAAIIKAIPGVLGWSLCQATTSLFGGVFHGATAGLIWGITLPLAIVLYWETFGNRRRQGSMLRPFGSIAFASISGVLTGLLVVMSIVGVFEVANLVEIGWLDKERIQHSREFWLDLFVVHRFGWVYPITGIGMGAGMAMVINTLRAKGSLRALLDDNEKISSMNQIWKLTGQVRKAFGWRKLWPLFVLPIISAAIALPIVKPGSMALKPKEETPVVLNADHRPKYTTRDMSKANLRGRVLGITGDLLSELAGGYGAVIGMGVGMVIMSRGVQVKPRKDMG